MRSRCRGPRISSQSRHSARSVSIQRSAKAFAFGALIGVRITRIPSDPKTASKERQNLASRSRMRKPGRKAVRGGPRAREQDDNATDERALRRRDILGNKDRRGHDALRSGRIGAARFGDPDHTVDQMQSAFWRGDHRRPDRAMVASAGHGCTRCPADPDPRRVHRLDCQRPARPARRRRPAARRGRPDRRPRISGCETSLRASRCSRANGAVRGESPWRRWQRLTWPVSTICPSRGGEARVPVRRLRMSVNAKSRSLHRSLDWRQGDFLQSSQGTYTPFGRW